jgi:hypothetical protein
MTKYNESPMVDTKGYIDVNAALKLKAADGKVEIAKIKAQTLANKVELLVKESAKETASKHLAKFAGFYLTFMVMAFIFSIKFIPSESIAVVAGLITLVVSNLSMILKGIVENGTKKESKGEEPE